MATPPPTGPTDPIPPLPQPPPATPERPPHQRRRRTRRILASEGVFDSIVSLAGILGRPVTQPDRSGDRPARRRRGPLVRRPDLPAGERAGHPGRAPAGLRPRVGHRPHRPRRGPAALGPARPARRRPPAGRGAPGQGRARTTSWSTWTASRSSAPPISTWPRCSAASAWWAPTCRRPRCCAGWGRAGGARRPTPDRVIDWAAIQPFGEDDGDRRRGHPGPPQDHPRGAAPACAPASWPTCSRTCAATSAGSCWPRCSPDEAADALEEMQPDDLEQLLRESDPDRGGAAFSPPWSPTRRSTRCATCPTGPCGRDPAAHAAHVRRCRCASCWATPRTRPAAS